MSQHRFSSSSTRQRFYRRRERNAKKKSHMMKLDPKMAQIERNVLGTVLVWASHANFFESWPIDPKISEVLIFFPPLVGILKINVPLLAKSDHHLAEFKISVDKFQSFLFLHKFGSVHPCIRWKLAVKLASTSNKLIVVSCSGTIASQRKIEWSGFKMPFFQVLEEIRVLKR